jgi:hypothetical protein
MAKNHAPFATKTVELGGLLAIDIPADWTYGPTEDGRWWCGDKANTVSVYTGIENFDVPPGAAAATPTGNIDPYVTKTLDFLRSENFAQIAVDPIQSGAVVHGVADYEEHGLPHRDYRWFTHNGRDTHVTRLRIMLAVDLKAWSGRRLDQLVSHFRDFAFTYDPCRLELDGALTASLKEHSVDGLFSFNIPDRWAWFTDEGTRFFRDATGSPAGLALRHHVIPLPPEVFALRPDLAHDIGRRRLNQPAAPDSKRIEATLLDAPLGVVLRLVEDDLAPASDDDDELRHHQWVYVIPRERDVLEVFFSCTIPLSALERPLHATLPGILEQEILALRLDPKLEFQQSVGQGPA